jgi:phosphomannomutase
MIPRHIFREYDIRGLHESELTDSVAESVGRAFATLVREGGGRRIALGQDVRPSSSRLAAGVERGVRASGLDVDRVGVVPTPALYYAVATTDADAGLQITGSHNPPEFNGFKMTRRRAPIFGAEIQSMRERIENGALAGGPASDEWVRYPSDSNWARDDWLAITIGRSIVTGGCDASAMSSR